MSQVFHSMFKWWAWITVPPHWSVEGLQSSREILSFCPQNPLKEWCDRSEKTPKSLDPSRWRFWCLFVFYCYSLDIGVPLIRDHALGLDFEIIMRLDHYSLIFMWPKTYCMLCLASRWSITLSVQHRWPQGSIPSIFLILRKQSMIRGCASKNSVLRDDEIWNIHSDR